MHRDLASLTDRIDRTLEQRLIPAIHPDREPVTVTAAHLPGEPVPFAEARAAEYAPFPVGGAWGPAWSTTWFRFTGEVPARMRGRRVELLVDLGFERAGPGFRSEGLAYSAAGVPIKGVEPRTAYVPIANPAGGREAVDVFVEAAANPRFDGTVSPLGDPATVPDRPLYRLDQAELAVVDEDVFALVLDVQVLHQLAQQLDDREPRRHEIRRALERVLDGLDVADVAAGVGEARAVLSEVLSAPAVASAHRVTATGHAHIDSAWLWPVRETIRKCARTFANVTALAAEYPELVFACSSAQQYAWMKDHHPQVYERISSAVAAGTFVPVGGTWVESDTNLPGGEALVRQFTYGKRFFADEFGVEPREVWLPDSFGYTAALPQLARLAGARWFLSQKMSWNTTNRFPHHTFWWEGIDGTRIFTHFPPADTYGAELTGEELARGVHQFAEHGHARHSLLPFGYGDGGGGPTREMLERARRLADLEGSPRVTVRAPAEFFADAEAEYPDAPVWSGEMYLEFHRGTYTSQVAMKRGNRRTEHLLREAELWAATAAVRGGFAYPYDELDAIWRETLLLQFHDILPGSSIAWVHRQARETYGALAGRIDAIVHSAITALAWSGDVPLVANAAPHGRDGVPALGLGAVDPEPGAVTVADTPDGVVLDNGRLRVTVGPDGTLASVWDVDAGREVLAGPGNVLQLHPDTPNRFDAWDLDEFYRHRRRDLTDTAKVEVDEALVRVTRHDGASTYVQTVRLEPGRPVVRFTTEVDWHEREHVLKVAFPIDVHAEYSTSEIQFGHVRRPTHANTSWDAARFEICAHRFLHVGETGYGAALLNDGTYGHDVTRSPAGEARGAAPTTVRLTLLRAPLYPDPSTDQGRHAFGYALVCGADVADAVREGYRANLPLRTVRGAGPVAPLVTVDAPAVVVESVKLADDRSGDVIVRLYESLGGRARATLTTSFDLAAATATDLLEREDSEIGALTPLDVDGRDVHLALSPFQVVTLRLARR